TASFLLMADTPGIPKPIKLQKQHREFFPLDKPITEECGRLLGWWAAGVRPIPAAPRPPIPEVGPAQGEVQLDELTTLYDLGKTRGLDANALLAKARDLAGDHGAKCFTLSKIERRDYERLYQ